MEKYYTKLRKLNALPQDRIIEELKAEIKELKEIINNKAKADLLKEHNKPKPGNIELRFQEEAINQMYDEQDDYHTGF